LTRCRQKWCHAKDSDRRRNEIFHEVTCLMAGVGADTQALGLIALIYSRVVVAVPILTDACFLPVSGLSQTREKTFG